MESIKWTVIMKLDTVVQHVAFPPHSLRMPAYDRELRLLSVWHFTRSISNCVGFCGFLGFPPTKTKKHAVWLIVEYKMPQDGNMSGRLYALWSVLARIMRSLNMNIL